MKIRIGNKEFEVRVGENDSENRIGLSETDKLPKGEGFAMKFNGSESIPINMMGMAFPIDIIFSLDGKVTKIITAKPDQEGIDINQPSDLIIEVNAGEASDIKAKDEITFIGKKNEDGTVEMAEGGLAAVGGRHVLDEDGKNQMNLVGEERIFSRKATKRMFDLAKANKYKKLGKFAITEIRAQDDRPEEYAEN